MPQDFGRSGQQSVLKLGYLCLACYNEIQREAEKIGKKIDKKRFTLRYINRIYQDEFSSPKPVLLIGVPYIGQTSGSIIAPV